MKIAFACKYNLFRSRIAEEYLKKISNHEVSSFGLFKTEVSPHPEQIHEAKKRGLDISPNSKTANMGDLKKLDYLIIVADDVPEEIFAHPSWLKDKIIKWNIPDIGNELSAREIIQKIISNIDSFVGGIKEK